MFKVRVARHKFPRMHKAESEFLRLNPGVTLRYEPERFYLSNGKRYTPDFYCEETQTFIEVVGSRQAYAINKRKYEMFVREYHPLAIVFVRDGMCRPYKQKGEKRQRSYFSRPRQWITTKEAQDILGLTRMQIVWRIKRAGLSVEKTNGKRSGWRMLSESDVDVIRNHGVREGNYRVGPRLKSSEPAKVEV